MQTLTKMISTLETGSLAEYLYDNCGLTQVENLLSQTPFKADLITWNLSEDAYREQIHVAIDWINKE